MNNSQFTVDENGVLRFDDSCKSVPSERFKNNINIKRIIIGKNIETIGKEAFSGCQNVEEIEIDKENTHYYCPDNSNSIVERDTNILVFGCSKTVIAEQVSGIGPFAFSDQHKLEKIHIPSNVKFLAPYSFDYCSSLVEVKMDDGLEEIEECCFRGCYGLETLYVPKTLKKVDETAFSLISNEDGIVDDGDVMVHAIHFSGLKQDFYRTFNINKLFIMDLNLQNHDMVINCEDGVILLSNDQIDY
ncbi:MAG: leucine-rich repeat domain-containing protein [Bacilli bacterium]|nr:leucine-rich repeat domain-containing protein [Bacilli bacterium]